MSWFFIALWAPFLIACANHNDKFVVSRYLKQKTIGSIVVLSSLFSGMAVPIVLFLQPDVSDITLLQGSALVATGLSSVCAAVCYLHALDMDEASLVTRSIRPCQSLLTSSDISRLVRRSPLLKDWVHSLLSLARLHCRLSLVGEELGSSEMLWHSC